MATTLNTKYTPNTQVRRLALEPGTYTLGFAGTGKIVYYADGVLTDIDDVNGTTLNSGNLTDDVTVSSFITYVADTDNGATLTVVSTETGISFGSLDEDDTDVAEQLGALANYNNVLIENNIITLDISKGNNFFVSIDDTEAKTIDIINIPNVDGRITNISLLVDYKDSASLEYPLETSWKDGIEPSFSINKAYQLFFTTYNSGSVLLASFIGAW